MNKHVMSAIMVCVSSTAINAYAGSIYVKDQKYGLLDINAKVGVELVATAAVSDTKSTYSDVYLDGTLLRLNKEASNDYGGLVACGDYTLTLNQDNSITASADYSHCVGTLRPSADSYAPGTLYQNNDLVSVINKKENTIGLYKCFQPSKCRDAEFGPEQTLGHFAWAQLSRGYLNPNSDKGSQSEDSVRVELRDCKHAPYVEDIGANIALTRTLQAKKKGINQINIKIDGTRLDLAAFDKTGKKCSYIATLDTDNSIFVKSDSCFKGYARKPSKNYEHGGEYDMGSIVVVQNITTNENEYYQCVHPVFCHLADYGPTEQLGLYAWVLVASNRYSGKCAFVGESLRAKTLP